MAVTVTPVPASGATPNSARSTWNTSDSDLATEINAHEAQGSSAHGGILTFADQAMKKAVRAVAVSVLPSNTYSAGVLTGASNGALPAQDGVSLNLGDRLLVPNEGGGSSLKNLIYTVTSLGSGSTRWVLTVASDSVNGNLLTEQRVAVSEGTELKGQVLYVITTGTITVGTTAIGWKRQSDTMPLCWGRAGTLSVGIIPYRFMVPSPGIIIVEIRATVNTAPTGASVIVDLQRATNAAPTAFSTLYTSNPKPTIAVSTYGVLASLPNTTGISPGDYLQPNITQVGSTVAGSDLTFEMFYTMWY